MTTHKCPHCLTVKSAENFQLYKNKPSGWCQTCRTELGRKTRAAQGIKPRKLSYIKDGQKLCMNCHILKDLVNFYRSKRGLGGISAYCKTCSIKRFHNKEKNRKTTAKYREKNRERWCAKHRIHQFNRRSKIKATEDGTVTDDFVKEIYNTQKCHFCKCNTPRKERTIEHLTPLSRGGLHSACNLVMACFRCNSSKRHLTEKEYKEKHGL